MKTRNMACFSVTPRLIEDAIKMPENHFIVGAEWDFASNSIRLYIEGDSLPEVPIGNMVQTINPSLTRQVDDDGKETVQWDWGISN